MGHQQVKPVYLCLNENLEVTKQHISVQELFGLETLSPQLHFNFEAHYIPYEVLVTGNLPRVDLVTIDTSPEKTICLRALEIKLTALPDEQTHDLSEAQYGCEIVVGPDTIVYLALSIALVYQRERTLLLDILNPICQNINNWEDMAEIQPLIPSMITQIDQILLTKLDKQSPLLLQPIWKTRGKSGILHDRCLDIFVWSDFSFTRLFIDPSQQASFRISRLSRSVVWLTKMLYDFTLRGRFDPADTIDKLTYNTKNDKAFSVDGKITHRYMTGQELTQPRISKDAFRHIILGGGQHFLSPERRLDAVILSTPDLFSMGLKI